MVRYAPLLLLLAACSSEPTDDALDDDGGSTTDVGDDGGTADDDGGPEESSGEGGSTGEPAPVWPPACVDDGTCGTLETLTDTAACEDDGLRVTGVAIAWGILNGSGGIEEAAGSAVVGECGEPLRWVYDEAVYLNAYRVTFTWANDAASWTCARVGTDIEPAEVDVGDAGQLELTGPYPFPTASSDCCQLSGEPVDGFAQTPC